MVLPLTSLIQKGKVFEWTNACQEAFDTVKKLLTHTPVLKMPDFTHPFEVVTDASDFVLDAVLMQDGHSIAFESRKLIPAEINYTMTEKELLASIHALKV